MRIYCIIQSLLPLWRKLSDTIPIEFNLAVYINGYFSRVDFIVQLKFYRVSFLPKFINVYLAFFYVGQKGNTISDPSI